MAIIGSAYVNIRAITTKLEDDIEKALSGIKDTLTINVDADTSRAQEKIASLIDSVETEDLFMPLHVETEAAAQSVEDFVDQSNRQNISIPVDATTVIANRQIALATRPRFVEIFANLNKTSWAKALAAIQAMSGSRVLITYFNDLARSISNMDKNAVKVASLTTALTTLAAAGIGAVGGIITVINDLVQVLGLLVIAPGMFMGFAAGALTTFLALKDMKTVLKDLGPAFTAIQDSVSAKFWGEAEKPIREMVDRLLPDLREGFDIAAVSIGQFFGQFATSMADAFDDGVFVELMQHVADSTDIAKGSLNDMAGSMAILGKVGASYLPRLATWWVDINAQFYAFLQRADADGTLVKWADNGIEATKLIGRALYSVGEMFYEIDRAATAAGGRGLLGLTENMEHFADLLAGETFQTAATNLFRGAHDAMSEVAGGIGRLGAGFAAASPSIEIALRTAGTAFSMFLTGIGEGMANPAFGGGLESMFDGFNAAMQAIYPSMGALGGAFGSFMGLIGQVAASIGRVLGPTITALAPLATPIFSIIGQLFTAMSSVLAQVIVAITPAITVLAGWLTTLAEKLSGVNPLFVALSGAGVVVAGIIGTLAANFISFAMAAAPLVSSMGGMAGILTVVKGAFAAIAGPIGILITALITAYATNDSFRASINNLLGSLWGLISGLVTQLIPPIMTLIQQILPGLVALFDMVATAVGQIITALMPFINMLTTMLLPILMTIINQVAPMLGGLINTLVTVIGAAISMLMPLIMGIAQSLIPVVTTIIASLVPLIDGLLATLGPIIQVIIDVVMRLVPLFADLAATFIPALVDAFNSVAMAVNGILMFLLPLIVTIINDLLPVITSIIVPALEFLGTMFTQVFNAIIPVVNNVLGIVSGIIKTVMGIITGDWSMAWEGIKQLVGNIFMGVVNVISGIIRILITTVWSGLVAIKDTVVGMGSALYQAGKDMIMGLVKGVNDMFANAVTAAVDGAKAMVNGVKNFLGIKSPSRLFRDQVGIMIGRGLVEGLNRSESMVEKAAESLAKSAIPDIPPLTTSMSINASRMFTDSANALPTTINSLGSQNAAGASGSTTLANSHAGPNIQLNVHPSEKMSEETIGLTAANELFWQFTNR